MINERTELGAQAARLLRGDRIAWLSMTTMRNTLHERVTLEPGETRTLRFTLGPGELCHWNAATRDW